MENQHRKIKGYRELTQEEIDLMNEIKSQGSELESIIEDCISRDLNSEQRRWIAVGQTHLQQGLMALTRAIANPDFF